MVELKQRPGVVAVELPAAAGAAAAAAAAVIQHCTLQPRKQLSKHQKVCSVCSVDVFSRSSFWVASCTIETQHHADPQPVLSDTLG